MKPGPARRTRTSAAPLSEPAPAQADGRRQRGARTRTIVLDGLLSLLAEGNYAPSMQQISERAGVSRRLVFHHFKDSESMQTEFAQRQRNLLLELAVPIPDSLPLGSRVQALVAQRAALYEKITHTRRAGLTREHVSPMIAQGLRAFRAIKRAQVEAVFAPEIRSCPPSLQAEIAAALSGAASFSTWESLRSHQQLGLEAAQRVLLQMLTGILRLTPAGAQLVVLNEQRPA